MILTYLFSPLIYLLIAIRKKKAISRILIIQTAKIGDLICSTPVFRAIKKKYPDAYISVIANPVTKELLEYNPNINEIITVKKTDYKGLSGKLKLSGLIRKGKYDIGICLNPNIPFAVALFWGFVPVRLSVMPDFSGFTFKLASVFFTHLEKHASGRMVIETYMQMLKTIGISSSDISKEVYKSEEADIKAKQILEEINKPVIGIAVSSANKLKELGTEKIVKLIDLLLNAIDGNIVLIGSNQDKNISDMVLGSVIQNNRIINAAGKLSLSELPALIERLSLFIGVDTGIIYMADALSVPIIHLAGPIDTSEQRPVGKNVKIIQYKLPCVPCTYVFKAAYNCKLQSRACINTIKTEDIVNAAKELISR
ncbi:MAG: glycosyltransferase family 9 protein [Thermodesulfovibrionales bacterium]